MAEKLLVAQALDERDFLYSKLTKLIKDSTFVETCREKDTAVKGKTIEDLNKDIASNYQSIIDQIDRYDRICRAITLSNAVTKIQFKNGKEMTIAEALAYKSNINSKKIDKQPLKSLLLHIMDIQIQDMRETELRIEADQQRNRDRYIQTQLENQANKEISPEFAKSIDVLLAPYNAKRIDPINIEEKYKAMEEEVSSTLAEIETLIKVSNATTYIEF
jgi:hypothetical protein